MIEAMACGLPCVVAALPGITNFVFGDDGSAGIIVPQADPGGARCGRRCDIGQTGPRLRDGGGEHANAPSVISTSSGSPIAIPSTTPSLSDVERRAPVSSLDRSGSERPPTRDTLPLARQFSRAAFWNTLLLPVIAALNLAFTILIRRWFGLFSGVYDVPPWCNGRVAAVLEPRHPGWSLEVPAGGRCLIRPSGGSALPTAGGGDPGLAAGSPARSPQCLRRADLAELRAWCRRPDLPRGAVQASHSGVSSSP